MIVKHTHDQCCDMLLSLGAAIVELVLMYRNLHYTIVVNYMLTFFKECSNVPMSVTLTALLKARRPRSVRTVANESGIIATVGR
jgi:hypothetical protein